MGQSSRPASLCANRRRTTVAPATTTTLTAVCWTRMAMLTLDSLQRQVVSARKAAPLVTMVGIRASPAGLTSHMMLIPPSKLQQMTQLRQCLVLHRTTISELGVLQQHWLRANLIT